MGCVATHPKQKSHCSWLCYSRINPVRASLHVRIINSELEAGISGDFFCFIFFFFLFIIYIFFFYFLFLFFLLKGQAGQSLDRNLCDHQIELQHPQNLLGYTYTQTHNTVHTQCICQANRDAVQTPLSTYTKARRPSITRPVGSTTILILSHHPQIYLRTPGSWL